MIIKRFLPSAGMAIGVTIGMGLVMAAMIATEFTPQEKVETLGFEINPVIEEVNEQPDRIVPEPHKQIETPPPPPVIARDKSPKPQEGIASVIGEIPVFKFPVLEPQNFTIQVADGDPQPLFRGTPLMPSRAERSGHCNVIFDVSAEGAPFNVRTSFCTQSLFERPTVKSVQRWTFKPKIQNGRPVSMTGLRNRVIYRLTDVRGNIIPE